MNNKKKTTHICKSPLFSEHKQNTFDLLFQCIFIFSYAFSVGMTGAGPLSCISYITRMKQLCVGLRAGDVLSFCGPHGLNHSKKHPVFIIVILLVAFVMALGFNRSLDFGYWPQRLPI